MGLLQIYISSSYPSLSWVRSCDIVSAPVSCRWSSWISMAAKVFSRSLRSFFNLFSVLWSEAAEDLSLPPPPPPFPKEETAEGRGLGWRRPQLDLPASSSSSSESIRPTIVRFSSAWNMGILWHNIVNRINSVSTSIYLLITYKRVFAFAVVSR